MVYNMHAPRLRWECFPWDHPTEARGSSYIYLGPTRTARISGGRISILEHQLHVFGPYSRVRISGGRTSILDIQLHAFGPYSRVRTGGGRSYILVHIRISGGRISIYYIEPSATC